MANNRKLCIDWYNKRLLVSDTNPQSYVLPAFQKYETIPLEVMIVEPGPSVTSPYIRLDVANISLTVAMHGSYDTAAPFASQSIWTKNTETNTFAGSLVLNTAAANTYIGSVDKTAYFEVEMVESGSRIKIYLATVNIKVGLLQPTITAPDPVREYYTRDQQDQLFLKPILTAGQTLTFTSPDGTVQRVLGVTNDSLPQDDIGLTI